MMACSGGQPSKPLPAAVFRFLAFLKGREVFKKLELGKSPSKAAWTSGEVLSFGKNVGTWQKFFQGQRLFFHGAPGIAALPRWTPALGRRSRNLPWPDG